MIRTLRDGSPGAGEGLACPPGAPPSRPVAVRAEAGAGAALVAAGGLPRVTDGFFDSAGVGGRDILAAFSASITVSDPPSMSSAGFKACPQL